MIKKEDIYKHLKKLDSKEKMKHTFSDYCDLWMENNMPKLKPSSISKYNSMLDKHILPFFKNYKIQEMNTSLINEFSNTLLYKEKLSVKTTRDILILLHEIIIYIQNKTGYNFSIEILYPKAERKELRVLSLQEQKDFIQFLQEDIDLYKISILLTLFTGLRIGEICGLQWKHISFETKTLQIRQTVQRIKNMDPTSNQKTTLAIGSPKTFSSIRTIPLTDKLLSLLEPFKNEDSEIFIMTGTLHPMDPRKLQRKLNSYMKELNIEGVHFHTLRHTFATRYIELGCDTKTLSEILGHSNISITMNRYVHPSLDFKRKNIEKLENTIAQ